MGLRHPFLYIYTQGYICGPKVVAWELLLADQSKVCLKKPSWLFITRFFFFTFYYFCFCWGSLTGIVSFLVSFQLYKPYLHALLFCSIVFCLRYALSARLKFMLKIYLEDACCVHGPLPNIPEAILLSLGRFFWTMSLAFKGCGVGQLR